MLVFNESLNQQNKLFQMSLLITVIKWILKFICIFYTI